MTRPLFATAQLPPPSGRAPLVAVQLFWGVVLWALVHSVAAQNLSTAAPVKVAMTPALDALEQAHRADPDAWMAALARLAVDRPLHDSERLLALAWRGHMLAVRNQLSAAQQALEAIEATSGQEPLADAAAAWVRAGLLARQGPLNRTEAVLEQALQRLPTGAPAGLRIRLQRLLGHAHGESGRFDEAVRLARDNLVLADEIGPDWRRADARIDLANVLLTFGQLDRARALSAEALALAQRSGDALAMSRAWSGESMVLGKLNDAAGELAAQNASLRAARLAGAHEDEVLGLANLADHYLKRGDYPKALQLAREALPLARAAQDADSESVALTNIGLALISMRQRREGLAAFREAMRIEAQAQALATMASLEEELGRYLQRAGYLADALAAYRRHRKLADEVFRQDRQRAVLELQERYDSEARRREQAWLESESRLKAAELHHHHLQQRLWWALAAAGALLLGLLAMLLHRLSRRRQALVAGNALLRSQSEQDPLTGLANRRHVQLQRPEDQRFEGGLILLDLDHFKRINDDHGHAAGDAVLVAVAGRLQAAVREMDLVARWGGEEFLVVSPPLSQAALDALAQRLLEAVGANPVGLKDRQAVLVSVSVGYAGFPLSPSDERRSWAQALSLVDTALYLAKAHGRNRACGVRRLDAEVCTEAGLDLEAAWRGGQAELVFQAGPATGGVSP